MKKKKNILLEIILWISAIVFFVPIYYLLVSTFKSADAITNEPFALPKTLDISNYIVAWEKMIYPRAFMNTFIITACTVLFSLFIAAIAAYSITRYKSKFNKFAFTLVLAGLMIPGQVSLVTLYTMVQKLHLIDSIWGMIVINCGGNTILPLFLHQW